MSTVPGPLEKDTCRDYVVPRLDAAGWKDRFVEQYRVTDGKIGRGSGTGTPSW